MRAADTKSDASLSASSDSTGDGGKIIPQEPSDIELKEFVKKGDTSKAVASATKGNPSGDHTPSSNKDNSGLRGFFGRLFGEDKSSDPPKTPESKPKPRPYRPFDVSGDN